MVTVLKIIGVILMVILLVVVGASLIFGLHYFVWFYWRPCKHCGHHMEYKGLKEDNDNGHFLFHCPECGAWQQIPKEEFFRDAKKAGFIDPYEAGL